MKTLTTVKRKKGEEKSRSFSVQLLGFLAHNSLLTTPLSQRDKKTFYPVYVAYAGSDLELQAFTANFRAGRPAKLLHEKLQLPKTTKYRWITHKLKGLSVTVAYLGDVFHLENDGTATGDCRFVFAPPTAWVDEQAEILRPDFGPDARDAARAALFAAYLDRRIGLPILADLEFHLRLYREALELDWVRPLAESRYRGGLWGEIHPRWGLDEPLGVHASTSRVEQFLVQQTQTFYQEEIQNGTHRFSTTGRLLPFPQDTATQLCFDFALDAETA